VQNVFCVGRRIRPGECAPTDRNPLTRALPEKREGIERAAFTTLDAAAGVAALRPRGLKDSIGPTGSGGQVDLADGHKAEAKLATFQWLLAECPGGLQNICLPTLHAGRCLVARTIEASKWRTSHIDHLEMLFADPVRAAAYVSRLVDMPVTIEADGAQRVETGAGRGVVLFLDRAMLEARLPGISLDGVPGEGASVLALRVEDAAQTAAVLGNVGIATKRGVVKVPPSAATGLLVLFSEG
jgi:hypothetical protein